MKSILTMYGEASGQEINLQKSEVSFSRNVPPDSRQHLSITLGVTASLGGGKYLGLPSLIGRSKRAVFSFIKDRVWRKISSWSAKSLSMAEDDEFLLVGL